MGSMLLLSSSPKVYCFCCSYHQNPSLFLRKSSSGGGFVGSIRTRSISSNVLSFSVTATALQPNYSKCKSRSLICKSQLGDVAPAASAVYGLLLLGGGLFAFNKSRSKGSLFGGLTGAALMSTAYFLMQSPDTKAYGDALAFGSALLFSCVFGIRLAATRKLTPSGPLLGVSVGALAVFIAAYLKDSV